MLQIATTYTAPNTSQTRVELVQKTYKQAITDPLFFNNGIRWVASAANLKPLSDF